MQSNIIDFGSWKDKGVFETIRAKNGQIEFFPEHLARLQKGAKFLNINFSQLPQENDLKILLTKNKLEKKLARLRIILTANQTLITAESYTPPDFNSYNQGIKLITADHPLKGKFAEFKILPRLPYIFLNKQAKKRNCYDTLLLDNKGNLLETTTANIFLLRENKLFIPKKENRLEGIMEKAVIERSQKMGYQIIRQNINIKKLSSADSFFITNSLIGLLPVKKINHQIILPLKTVSKIAVTPKRRVKI